MKKIKKKTSLEMLESFGQSVWLDYIQRDMIRSGQLRKLIEEYSISGVTSNPAIFEKAIDGSHDYDDDIGRFISEGENAKDIYEMLTVRDVQNG